MNCVAQCHDERTLLMLYLAAGEGLRRGEIARVHTDDIQLGHDLQNGKLLVHGKGGKIRVVPLWPEIAQLILRHSPGWVFPGQKDGHLSPGYVGKLIAQAMPGAYTAHTLRHSLATRLYEATGDIAIVQKWLGHENLQTTQVYVQVADSRLACGLKALGSPLPNS